MAHRNTAPYAPQDPTQVRALVDSLQAHKGKKDKAGFSVKNHTFALPNGRTVDSWKLSDWDYKKPHLPTYARGLFTYQTLDGHPEIAIRGYDKFFNHGEVRKTEWKHVECHSRGPYELSVKENGCIIFISGLDDNTLLVCSKHSTGARGDQALSHACAGEKWVDKHIASVGKTKEQLAQTLRAMNATLVAELCDDEFEEHVLPYTLDQAGLYVHGLNLNLPQFATYPGPLVDRFADEWGMKKVRYIMQDDIAQVKRFLDTVAQTGHFDGRDTEGFVIRCQARETPTAPYVDWFFKYKFEEPYLMYRQWRECTKSIIAGKQPRYKKHKLITNEYLEFARRQLVQQPGLAKSYNQNHGIIKLRNDFLRFRGTSGADIIRQEMENAHADHATIDRNLILTPIATIGCGKTTLALALVKLFAWGHCQNDDVPTKRGRPQIFANTVFSLTATHPVVVADRNNHERRERLQLITDVSRFVPEARFVALHYVHDRSNYDQIRDATRKRVFNRGDNHQTIQANSKSSAEITNIMEGFLHRFQPLDSSEAPDDLFDSVINLDPTRDSRENLKVTVTHLFVTYPGLFHGRDMPADSEMDAAVQWAMDEYQPDLKMDLSRRANGKSRPSKRNGKPNSPNTGGRNAAHRGGELEQAAKSNKLARVEYFAVRLPSPLIHSILEASLNGQDSATAHFFQQLQQSQRVQNEFHVTLMHRASLPEHQTYWDQLTKLHQHCLQTASNGTAGEVELGKCDVLTERLIWDGRVMCLVVRLNGSATLHVIHNPLSSEKEGGEEAEEELAFKTVNAVAHMTIGTANAGIKPFESNALLQRWLNEGPSEQSGIRERTVKANAPIQGSVRGVLSRR